MSLITITGDPGPGEDIYLRQLGAGLWPIAERLARVDKPAGASLLECGQTFGFGLDFATAIPGWTGLTSTAAVTGNGAPGPYDVILVTEYLETAEIPPDFLPALREKMPPDGIIIVTAPDQPALRAALEAAGFAHIVMIQEPGAALAYASAAEFTLRDDPPASLKSTYRHYLATRAAACDPGSDLQLGFAGRLLFEAVNDRDPLAAAAAWSILHPAVQTRFGIDLEIITALPPDSGTGGLADLADLARLMPLGLGIILFSRAMDLQSRNVSRAALLPLFRLAAAAIAKLQAALAKRGKTDGLSASIEAQAATEIALCLAETGDDTAIPALIAAAQTGETLPAWRGFVAFVNAGAFASAKALQASLDLTWPAADLPADLRLDVLGTLGNLALAAGEDPAGALPAARALLESNAGPGIAAGLILGAFTRLVNAARFTEAQTAADDFNIPALIASTTGETAADARIAAIQLAFGLQNPSAAAAQLLASAPPPGESVILDRLYAEAFIRLTNAGDFATAATLNAGGAITQRLAVLALRPRQDALAAQLALALEPGSDIATIPDLLTALHEAKTNETRFHNLLFASFVKLVNEAAFETAALLRPLVTLALQRLQPPYEPAGRDALFAYGVLAWADKKNLPQGALALRRLRDDITKHSRAGTGADPLFWPALRVEVFILGQLSRQDDKARLLARSLQRYPDAPADLLALAA